MNRINSLSKLICVAISDRAVIGVFESAVMKVPFSVVVVTVSMSWIHLQLIRGFDPPS